MVEEDILKEHKKIFISASCELINNNTSSLIDDDIIMGIINPPLETMDIIKSRLLTIAKDNNLVLKADVLNDILATYKKSLAKEFRKIGEKRQKFISKYVEDIDVDKPLGVLKKLKKELDKFDKEIKKESKEVIKRLVNEEIIANVDKINEDNMSKYKKEVLDFLQITYVKQFLELLEMKIIVKDTILLNSLKEHIERFIFTTENSHLFD